MLDVFGGITPEEAQREAAHLEGALVRKVAEQEGKAEYRDKPDHGDYEVGSTSVDVAVKLFGITIIDSVLDTFEHSIELSRELTDEQDAALQHVFRSNQERNAEDMEAIEQAHIDAFYSPEDPSKVDQLVEMVKSFFARLQGEITGDDAVKEAFRDDPYLLKEALNKLKMDVSIVLGKISLDIKGSA